MNWPLHIEQTGTPGQTTYLAIHGFGGGTYTWRHLKPFLSQKGHFVAVDLLGFGQSPRLTEHLEHYHPFAQADHIFQWLIKNQVKDLVLIGHSLGGSIALRLAHQILQEKTMSLTHLILLAPACYPQKHPWFMHLPANKTVLSLIERCLPAQFLIEKIIKHSTSTKSPVDRQSIRTYAQYLKPKNSLLAWQKTAQYLKAPEVIAFPKEYKQLNVPTTIIWGEQDPIISPQLGVQLAQDLPQASLRTIKQCGHIPQEEKPQEVLTILKTI